MAQPLSPPQIHDRASLEVWMADMPREFVVVTATRAVLRALPMFVRDLNGAPTHEFRAVLLRSLRALATANTGMTWPRRVSEIWHVAVAVESYVRVGVSIAERSNHTTAACICSAVTAIVRLFAYPTAYILHSANATSAANDLVGTGAWEAVCWDAGRLAAAWTGTGGAVLLAAGMERQPLWPECVPPQASRAWTNLKLSLPSDDNWWVWVDWYEDRLLGRPSNQALEFARVTIADREWERCPAHVNRLIAQLIEPTKYWPQNPHPKTPVDL